MKTPEVITLDTIIGPEAVAETAAVLAELENTSRDVRAWLDDMAMKSTSRLTAMHPASVEIATLLTTLEVA